MPLSRCNLLIDGYNLMHAAGFARERYAPGELEQERVRFLDWLWRRLPPGLRGRTVVVFDGGGSDNQYVGQAAFRELRLLFSPRGLEADDLLEELIEQHSSPRQLQVISSDHRLHRAARGRKATCLDSEDFLATLARLARQARERQRELEELSKPTGELPDQMREWLAVFAEADEWLAAARREKGVDASGSSGGGAAPTPAPTSIPAPAPLSAPSPAPPLNAAAGSVASLSPSPPTPRPNPLAPSSPAPTIDADELAFWEACLAELLTPPEP